MRLNLGKKVVKVALCTVRNEEQGIRGWAEMMLSFAERVVCLLDPDTTDRTEEILVDEFPEVEIVYQDRSLGDSDDDTEGPTKSLIMHENKTKWIRENIDDWDWFLEIAVDERFHIGDWKQLRYEVDYAQKHGYGAIMHTTMYEPISFHTDQLVVDEDGFEWINPSIKPSALQYNIPHNYTIDWNRYTNMYHCRFQQKTPWWSQNKLPHHSFSKRFAILPSTIPLWHFHRIKYNSVQTVNWRDGRGSMNRMINYFNGLIPIKPLPLIFDWKSNNIIDYKIPALIELNEQRKDKVCCEMMDSIRPNINNIIN